jgi:hypothetical protein
MMELIQKQALTRITGAFRMTAGLALTTCLHVMPVMVVLNLEVLRACLRVCTSPLYARIQAIRNVLPVKKEPFYWWKRGPDWNPLLPPLRRLEILLPIKPAQLETIEPWVTPPWWTPPGTSIAATKEEAVKAHAALQPGIIRIYTDGSGTSTGVGAAAVSSLGIDTAHMGDLTKQTVYAVELKGIEMALAWLWLQRGTPGSAMILTDNQAAIQACSSPRWSSGQHILHGIVRHLEALRGWDIRL